MLLRRYALPLPAFVLLLALAARPAPAQTLPPPAAPAASPLPDLLPLKKALAPLSASRLLETNSVFQMTGSRGGTAFTFRQNAHILARRGGQFRAELTQVGVNGAPQARLVVVSDGRTVWTYRPGLRAYSLTTRKAFLGASDDVTVLGLAIGSFFLGDGHDLADGFHEITKENSQEVLTALSGAGVTLTAKAQSSGGVDYFVYRLVLEKQGMAYLFYVDTQTSTLKRIDLAGTAGGMQIAFQETLTALRVPSAAPAGAFTWTPPPGTKKSAAVTADPF